MGGGVVRRKVLFRAGRKQIFCLPSFENVSPGNGSDWVKETLCFVKEEWKFIFHWFYNVLFFIFVFYYILCIILRGGL